MATPDRTYGCHQVEILAALTNGVVLVVISLFILGEALERLRKPPEVAAGQMVAIASAALVVNLASVFLLKRGSGESLNVRGAYLEVLSDMVASMGVILAGAVMWATGWRYADPIVSAGIGLFILPRTTRRRVRTRPARLDADDRDERLQRPRRALLGCRPRRRPGRVRRCVRSRFDIAHVTLQIEEAGYGDSSSHV